MSDANPEKIGPADENHLIAERRAKLAKLRERGNAFPNDFRRDALAADILTAYGEKSAEALDAAAVPVRVPGAGGARGGVCRGEVCSPPASLRGRPAFSS